MTYLQLKLQAKASVALINEKGEVSLEASDEKMNHLQNLIPIIDFVEKARIV